MARTYSAHYIIMVGKVGLASLAAIDSLAVEINVVCQAHVAVSWAAA
jgi:hypothetical protein